MIIALTGSLLSLSAATLFKRAIALLRSGDPQAAALLARLEEFPDYGPGWLALGEILHDRGQRAAALAAFGRAARASPPSSHAAHRLGQSAASIGKHAEAIAAFRRALAIDPKSSAVWYSLALAQQDAGQHAEAARSYRAALRARPDFHEAALNLGLALQAQGELEAALDAYALALHLRAESFGRIAQSLVSGRCGMLWLDPAELRRILVERHLAPGTRA